MGCLEGGMEVGDGLKYFCFNCVGGFENSLRLLSPAFRGFTPDAEKSNETERTQAKLPNVT
jgi:hypothetical protein